MLNGVKEEPNELQQVKPLLLYRVDFVNRLYFILVQDSNQIRQRVLVYQLISLIVF